MIKNIYVFTKYQRKGASSRVRFFDYLPLFSSNIKFAHSSLFDDNYIDSLYSGKKVSFLKVIILYLIRLYHVFRVTFSRKYDIVWIEKELFPYIPIPFEMLFVYFGKKIVYDYDDAVFHNYDRVKLKSLFNWKFSILAKNSDLIFAGNNYLADCLVKFGAKNVEIIPTVIDWKRYQSVYSDEGALGSILDKPLKIVWIGTPSTEKYLSIIDESITRLQMQYSIDFHVIGASNDLQLKCEFVRKTWTKDSEVQLLADGDIGVMPLHDSMFEKGKCGYKIIQYFALAKPVCASPIGINAELIEDSVNGYLCSTSEDWYKALRKLILDRNHRNYLGEKGMDLVSKKYTYHIQAPRIERFLLGLNK